MGNDTEYYDVGNIETIAVIEAKLTPENPLKDAVKLSEYSTFLAETLTKQKTRDD